MLRLILSPRWILWHLLTLSAMVTCGLLSAWQWSRAGSSLGSPLNVGYGLQWPLFAVFFAVMWWRFLRMELAKLHDGPEDAGETTTGATAVAGPVAEPVAAVAPQAPAAAPADGPSPFGPRPATWRAAPVTDEENPQLAAYNRMLAALAARDAAG